MKRLIIAILSFISETFSGWFEEVADGIENRNAKAVVTNALLIIIWGVAIVLIIAFLGLLIIRNMTIFVIGAFLAAALYSAVAKLSGSDEKGDGGPAPQPTMEEYCSVMEIVRQAAKRVGPALSLAEIYEETDLRAAKDERILQHGSYWYFKYRLPKKNATISIDTVLTRRVLQREIQSVIESDNPGSFINTRIVHGGITECIVQVDKISDGDAFAYLYCVIASETYFNQKSRNRFSNTADTYDTDF